MCGIVGAFAFAENGPPISREFLKAMADAVAHRGPDGEGFWLSADRRVGLGHRRLAIIDLSEAASQPMASADGRWTLAFNGEVYNHAEIRAELESEGVGDWKTDHSDTEVILKSFEREGIGCLARFRGMFAIAAWDGLKRELWLVRDRIGVKPLYWTRHHGRFVFGSEIKSLLADPELCRIVNEAALPAYLTALTVPAPETMFKGVYKLPAGHWIRVSETGETEERRWWDPLDQREMLRGLSDDEIAERLREEIRTAVHYRKVSDVPVGVFLSGGIDSSTNAKLFGEGESGAVKTFSIGYDADYGSYPNELEHARRMADLIGAEHFERRLSEKDLLDFLPQMIHLQDEPIADPVCVPVYYVSKLARDHGVIVAQVGEGADELFCGYRGWKAALMLDRLNRIPFPRAGKRAALGLVDLMGKQDSPQRERLRRAANGRPVFWGGAEAFTEFEKGQILSPRLASGTDYWNVLEPIWERFHAKAAEPSALNWMTYLDLSIRLPELLLMRVDKMSMGVSLEARVPFLDHKVVELAFAIPTETKFRGRELKSILKKAVRGLIPNEVIERKKQGFGVPIHEWFLARLGNQARADLREFTRATDYFQPGAVDALFEKNRAQQAWYLWNFALWHRHFIDS